VLDPYEEKGGRLRRRPRNTKNNKDAGLKARR